MQCTYLEQGSVYTKQEPKRSQLSTVLLLDCCLKIKIFGTELTELGCGRAEGDDLGFLSSSSDEDAENTLLK